MRYGFDLDGTLCYTVGQDYANATPRMDVIARVNELYDQGHHITIDTARGSGTGLDWHARTATQLRSWGVKYHLLRTGVKIAFDRYIGDEAENIETWMEHAPVRV